MVVGTLSRLAYQLLKADLTRIEGNLVLISLVCMHPVKSFSKAKRNCLIFQLPFLAYFPFLYQFPILMVIPVMVFIMNSKLEPKFVCQQNSFQCFAPI